MTTQTTRLGMKYVKGADAARCVGWAMACVTSRAFRVAGPAKPASLLPLVDMCNHSFQPSARLVPGPGGAMDLLALHHLLPASAVVINYGVLTFPAAAVVKMRCCCSSRNGYLGRV